VKDIRGQVHLFETQTIQWLDRNEQYQISGNKMINFLIVIFNEYSLLYILIYVISGQNLLNVQGKVSL